jgi:prepilin-type N-terminal cleavage/methylation domain-containing protein
MSSKSCCKVNIYYLKLFMKKLSKIFSLSSKAGFTMIELLVVIAVIGVLAVAVLSSINPIEQINKGRDTRTRSDAAQLINAIDRYYAIHEKYPWNVTVSGGYTASSTLPNTTFVMGAVTGTGESAVITTTSGEWDYVDVLVSTAEVKEGYTNRLKEDNKQLVFKDTGFNQTMYACFLPTSNAFEQEAMENCADGVTPDAGDSGVPAGVDPCEDSADITAANMICLP